MKNTIKTSILLAIIAIACLLTTYQSEAAAPIPGINIVIKIVPGGNIIKAASNDGDGKYTFRAEGLGDCDIMLVASEEYFEAKSKDKGNNLIAIYDFTGSVQQKKSYKGGGSDQDSLQTVNTSRSNIKRRVEIKRGSMTDGLIKMTIDGKTVYAKVLFKGVNWGDSVGAIITIKHFGIHQPGVK